MYCWGEFSGIDMFQWSTGGAILFQLTMSLNIFLKMFVICVSFYVLMCLFDFFFLIILLCLPTF